MDEPKFGTKEVIRRRQFRSRWIIVSAIYISMCLALLFLGNNSERSDIILRGGILLGLLSMVYVHLRRFSQGDEFERSIELKAAGVGFLTTIILSAIFSFLGPEYGQIQYVGFATLFLGFLSFSVARFKFTKGLHTA